MASPIVSNSQISDELAELRAGGNAFGELSYQQIFDAFRDFVPGPAVAANGVVLTADAQIVYIRFDDGFASLTPLAGSAAAISDSERVAIVYLCSTPRMESERIFVTPAVREALANNHALEADLPPRPIVEHSLISRDGARSRPLPAGGGSVEIGRHGSPELLSADDRMVSRRHATLEGSREGLEGEVVWRITNHSANNTYLNGEPVQAGTPLRRGDRIAMGTAEFLFTNNLPADNDRVDSELGCGNTILAIAAGEIASADVTGFRPIFLDCVMDKKDANNPQHVLAEIAQQHRLGMIADQDDPSLQHAQEERRQAASRELILNLNKLGAMDVVIDHQGYPVRFTVNPEVMLRGTRDEIQDRLSKAVAIAPLAIVVLPTPTRLARWGEYDIGRYHDLVSCEAFQKIPGMMFQAGDESAVSPELFQGCKGVYSLKVLGLTASSGARLWFSQGGVEALVRSPLISNVTSLHLERVDGGNQNMSSYQLLTGDYPESPAHRLTHLTLSDCHLGSVTIERLMRLDEIPPEQLAALEGRIPLWTIDEDIPSPFLSALLGPDSGLRLRSLEIHRSQFSDSSMDIVVASTSAKTIEKLRIPVGGAIFPDPPMAPERLVAALRPENFPALTHLTLEFLVYPSGGWADACLALREIWGDRLRFVS